MRKRHESCCSFMWDTMECELEIYCRPINEKRNSRERNKSYRKHTLLWYERKIKVRLLDLWGEEGVQKTFYKVVWHDFSELNKCYSKTFCGSMHEREQKRRSHLCKVKQRKSKGYQDNNVQ